MSFWTILDNAGVPVAANVEAEAEPDAGVYGGVSAMLNARQIDVTLMRWNGQAWEDDLDQLRARKWDAIKAERERRRVVITTSFGSFDADETAKSNMLGKLLSFNQLGDAAPDRVIWKLHDNQFADMLRADFVSACLAVLAGVEAVYAASFALEAQVKSASTAGEIAAIDPEQGWPA